VRASSLSTSGIGKKLNRTGGRVAAHASLDPVIQFVEDHVEPGSFRYVGAGAKVGQADRIICWFKIRGATKTRAGFGDLSVRDVTRSELPLDIAN
jgi:hypothetical protein